MNFIEAHENYKNRLKQSLSKINDVDLAKKRLTYSRWKVAENLDKLLFEFETNVKKNDANVIWCPDSKSSLLNLNKHLKSYEKIKFFRHNAVKHFVNELDLKLPPNSEDPEVVIIGAKFIMANSGNFYSAFESKDDFKKIINAKKIIVIAGIDSVLALQSELCMAKQMYAIFETGNLNYESEILGRPGRARGFNSEIVLFLTDLNKNKLLDSPFHRPLFSLSNFELPPVCPLQALTYNPEDWQKRSTLSFVLFAFMHGLKEFKGNIEGNYGLKTLNQYLPYDIDLYEQILGVRAVLNIEEGVSYSVFNNLIDLNKLSIALNHKKFENKEKFIKFAERNFYGKL